MPSLSLSQKEQRAQILGALPLPCGSGNGSARAASRSFLAFRGGPLEPDRYDDA